MGGRGYGKGLLGGPYIFRRLGSVTIVMDLIPNWHVAMHLQIGVIWLIKASWKGISLGELVKDTHSSPSSV